MQRTRPARPVRPEDRRQRRNNAPLRPAGGPAVLPAILLTLALCALTMSAVIFASSFVNVAGQAGGGLARLFAAALLATGLFTFALAFGLMGNDRPEPNSYILPVILGILMGAAEAWFLIAPEVPLTPLPFLLLVLLAPPLRRRIERMASPSRGFNG